MSSELRFDTATGEAVSIRLRYDVRAAGVISARVLEVAAIFGIEIDDRTGPCDEASMVPLIDECDIPLPPGAAVFITGPSGSGKSTILRLISDAFTSRAHASRRHDDRLILREIDLNGPWPQRALIDLFPEVSLQAAMSLLSRAGLSEARVMMRTPWELSEGQRARLAIARLLYECDRDASGRTVLLIDEFAATLDRLSAAALARSLGRWVRRTRHTLIVAAAHDDVLEALEPEVLVFKRLGSRVDVHTGARAIPDSELSDLQHGRFTQRSLQSM